MEKLMMEKKERSIPEPDRGVRSLVEISIEALERLYLPSEGLFCFRAYPEQAVPLKLEGVSVRYTAMSLIGLYEARAHDYRSQIDLSRILEGLIQKHLPSALYPEKGLFLWADSVGDRKYSEAIWQAIKSDERYIFNPDQKYDQYPSMDIGLLLTGLSYYYPYANDQREVARYCKRLAERIRSNFIEQTGLFREDVIIRRKNFLKARTQNCISSFASQVYPLTALAAYSRFLEDPTFVGAAQKCAETLCRFQGDKGQWPWLYNVTTGTLADSYPVYSVHQGGMGPFALFELQKALKTNRYEAAAFKGLNWLWGHNELGKPITDENQQTIWRAIQRRDSDAVGPYGIGPSGQCNRNLSAWCGGASLERFFNKQIGHEFLQETRPYEYGWYLWAFAGYPS